MDDELLDGLAKRLLKSSFVVGTAHPKIREVMQIPAEDEFAVSGVGARIEDMGVPEGIDRPGGTDLLVGIARVQRQKLTIERFDVLAKLRRPAALVNQLPLEHREIKLTDAVERATERGIARDHRLRSFE